MFMYPFNLGKRRKPNDPTQAEVGTMNKLESLRNELADKYETDMSGQSNYLSCKYDFAQGWDACISYLKGKVEFDENEVHGYLGEGSSYKAGARWMFDQLSARVALAERVASNHIDLAAKYSREGAQLQQRVEVAERWREKYYDKVTELNVAEARCKELEVAYDALNAIKGVGNDRR